MFFETSDKAMQVTGWFYCEVIITKTRSNVFYYFL